MTRSIFNRLRFGLAMIVWLVLTSPAQAQEPVSVHRQEDVIYGRKDGVALTMDVFQPAKPNGIGLIFIVSGGWFSSKAAISPRAYQYFIDNGYTVFAVVHGSQPKFQIPEIIRDINRSVRYIRHNAAAFKIDPDHLGILGMSAGGHLSLIIATQGRQGDPKALDPVDRESSAVQCVACFFPPTDFLNYGAPHTNVIGEGRLEKYKAAFGNVPTNPVARDDYAKSISPIYSLTTNLPPTLIIQGDADPTVPEQQALSFRDRAVALGDTVKVIVKPGEGHGWKNYRPDLESCTAWFDRYLRDRKTE